MTRILIVDDHPLVRRGLGEAITDDMPGLEVGEAGNAEQALARMGQETWDLAILDISMEGPSGLELLEKIRALAPKMPVLMLSMHAETDFAVRALRLGAAGFVSKQAAPQEVLGAVRKVLGGGRYVSAVVAERLAKDLQGEKGGPPHELLSQREMQVLRMIAEGKALKEIAAELSLSVKTVGTYHLRLMEKLGAKNDVELTRYALNHRLVE